MGSSMKPAERPASDGRSDTWLRQRLRMVLLHPSLVPYALSHRSQGATWARFRELELARPPWPRIRASISSRPGRTFTLNGAAFPYFDHPYNHTWANERRVEVPLALARLRALGGGRCLEVGNVLSHYANRSPDWTIVDKYERAEGVVNVDFLEFAPRTGFDLVLSVSTLEHIGWDEQPRD
ncbi:MAG: hypothetical protein L3J93_05300, partial [Thermoplasmata archaeon]|nr:hypothetical protein [Thermoplasmata archaeon]